MEFSKDFQYSDNYIVILPSIMVRNVKSVVEAQVFIFRGHASVRVANAFIQMPRISSPMIVLNSTNLEGDLTVENFTAWCAGGCAPAWKRAYMNVWFLTPFSGSDHYDQEAVASIIDNKPWIKCDGGHLLIYPDNGNLSKRQRRMSTRPHFEKDPSKMSKLICHTCGIDTEYKEIDGHGFCRSCPAYAYSIGGTQKCHLPVDVRAIFCAFLCVFQAMVAILFVGQPNPITDVRLNFSGGKRRFRVSLQRSLGPVMRSLARIGVYFTLNGTGIDNVLDNGLFSMEVCNSCLIELRNMDGTLASADVMAASSKGFLQAVQARTLIFVMCTTLFLGSAALVPILNLLNGSDNCHIKLLLHGFVDYVVGVVMWSVIALCLWKFRLRKLWKLHNITPIQSTHLEYMKSVHPVPYTGEDSAHPKRQGLAAEVLHELYRHYESFIMERSMHYVVGDMPLTSKRQISFSTMWGGRTVNHFVSHCWGTSFAHFCTSIRAHAAQVAAVDWRMETYWICSFSNNQWDVEGELGDTIMDSTFARVLQGGSVLDTVMVLDNDVKPLTRVWCLFEILITKSQNLDLEFACDTGLLNAPTDDSVSLDIIMTIAAKIKELKVADCRASNEKDREDILSMIVSRLGSLDAMDKEIRCIMLEGIQFVVQRVNDLSSDFAALVGSHSPAAKRHNLRILEVDHRLHHRWSLGAGSNPMAPLPPVDDALAELASMQDEITPYLSLPARLPRITIRSPFSELSSRLLDHDEALENASRSLPHAREGSDIEMQEYSDIIEL